jgi:hypothetical protein
LARWPRPGIALGSPILEILREEEEAKRRQGA